MNATTVTTMKGNKIWLFFILLSLAMPASMNGQNPGPLVFEKNNPLLIRSFGPEIRMERKLPLISYQLDETIHSTEKLSDKVEISCSQVTPAPGIKMVITFRNISGDTLCLHNVVPLGRDDRHIYITGRGPHYLSRSYLFRPGYSPVNVILPDNAWELGFSCVETDGDNHLVALTRRDNKSLQNGRLKRFETILHPGGSIQYALWLESYRGEWQNGLRLMFQERYLYDVAPGTFDNSLFEREDLQWIRNCYAANLMMAWDRRFYDQADGSYHVEDYLKKMKQLMGGYDIFGIWPTWPALGMDQRNQWDMFRDLPRGFDQLKAISEICHQNGAYFFLCYNPWDESTRSDEDHLDGMSNITRVADIDGFVLDTRGASSKELQDAVDAARKGVVMYSEGMAVPRDMQGIVSGRVHNALYYPPLLNLNKFIKPEFAIFRVAEEAREPIRREFNISFFNGHGTEINSFPPGRFGWSDEQLRYWGQLLRVQREHSNNFLQAAYTPLIPTLADSIYVNRWLGLSKTLYTVFNLHPEGFCGNLFEVEPPGDNEHYLDLLRHEELEVNSINGKHYLKVSLQGFHIADLGTNNESSVTAIALFPARLKVRLEGDLLTFSSSEGDSIRLWAGLPTYGKRAATFGIGGHSIRLLHHFPGYEGKFVIQAMQGEEVIDERIINITPGTARLLSEAETTEPAATAPEGMVFIPSGYFQCDNYRTGDSFIPYPPHPTENGERIFMKSFFMDRYPVTNRQYREFIRATGYQPKDTTNFLKHWVNGKIPPGEEDYPVIYVTIEDAKAYARWAGKRLPTEVEWQYAAQTEAGNEWPWIQETPVEREEEFITNTLSVWHIRGIDSTRCNLGDGYLYPVGKYEKGVNPYGLYDLVGSVWQLTSDVYDNTTYRYIMVKGGSYFMPKSSFWYVQGGPRELNYRQYLLRLSPGFERKATVGFRCVKDAL
jgi:formylglycine-generating enzyme required for sulfatase activity